ncbi:pullulanase X25 domain-containing protein [Haloferula sargassicola]|uniref:Amylopullulanase X25 domain-containing protein n=1 Tax=Haloferula sargassicola TaxID=490096 RepID=A0ABP9UNB7_9BACT
MNRTIILGAALLAPLSVHGALVVAGSLQTEQGDPLDWDPATSSLIMSESGGVHTVTATGLTPGASYEFKVLDDGGTPPAAWGDPEITPDNVLAWGGSGGTLSITVDSNLTNNVGRSQVWVNSDMATLQVVGSFMVQAGGASDWNPADPSFLTTHAGGGLYTYTATISAPGAYDFKATDGTGWTHQVGPDGSSGNAATFSFSTTSPDEQVVLFIDLANRQMGVMPVPEPGVVLLGSLGLLAMLRRRV